MGKGIGGHGRPNRGISVEWQTPPYILRAVGPFDDDPCMPGKLDGLIRPWTGFVWLNPPYGNDMWPWLNKLALHGDGIALIFARTETRGFFREVWGKATSLFFIKGRPRFYKNGQEANGNCGGPVVLVGYGKEAHRRLYECALPGVFIGGWTRPSEL